MSISLPSREIYSIDVPEVLRFNAAFQYNFFTPDESVSDTGGISSKLLRRSALEQDAAFIQRIGTIAPRFVVIDWKVPVIVDSTNKVSDRQQRNNVFSSNVQNGSLIADNLNKVITENEFSLNNFIGVNFHDSEIDDKIHNQVSGSYELNALSSPSDPNVSHYKAAQRLSSLTPKHIKPHFLYKALSNPSTAYNTRFFDSDGQRIFSDYFRKLKDVVINVQINGKFFHDIATRSIRDPNSQFAADLHSMQKFTKNLRDNSIQRASFRAQISESDFRTVVPYFDVTYGVAASNQDTQLPEIIGYIIDKVEITESGEPKVHHPIIIDNPNVASTIDYQVKYGTTYIYSIRSVAYFNVLAIDDDTNEPAIIRTLISSKPSNKIYVETIETKAPPAPSDVNFTWNYERINPATAQYDVTSGQPMLETGKPGCLMIHWTFPPNSQRDIKKFQIFRRRNINHPFELIKVYDFDDSARRFPDRENPDPRLVERLTSPCTFYFDDDFFTGNHNFHDSSSGKDPEHERHPYSSTYIYAVAAIDAHGYTSNYSAQFEVWFDPFKNKLQKKLISHSGAPKPYPNLYLEADAFVDTIRVAGPHTKKARLIFNPEYYYVTDDQSRMTQILSTKQTGGNYKLQFINLDNQKSAVTTIAIDDRLSSTSKEPAQPAIRFGKRKSANSRSRGR
jgi:hypothetical protein